MGQVSIRRLLAKDNIRFLLGFLQSLDQPIAITDEDHHILLGSPQVAQDGEPGMPIRYKGGEVGWVLGQAPEHVRNGIVSLVSFLIDQENQKKELVNEVLGRYRQLNLMYRLAGRLITSPQPEVIANVALEETCPLIRSLFGLILLRTGEDGPLDLVASCGPARQPREGAWDAESIVNRVFISGNAEITNELPENRYFEYINGGNISILCAPLKTEVKVIGVIVLVRDTPESFTAGDLKLVNTIALQVAPAIEIARYHQLSLESARIERDLQNARQVQADLLPRTMPIIDGWELSAYWQPARVVSGDFYDFIPLTNGRLGIVVGDVADKGMPAALVMANTRSVIRAVIGGISRRGRDTPGMLLAKVNSLLYNDMPEHMFVTCFLAILDPSTGRLSFSNAGHPLPYQYRSRESGEIFELCATGLPLGLFPRATYDDRETVLSPGDRLLICSDGLIEAHNRQGEMFDNENVRAVLHEVLSHGEIKGEQIIKAMTNALALHTGPGMEQEDDVTLVVLDRLLAIET